MAKTPVLSPVSKVLLAALVVVLLVLTEKEIGILLSLISSSILLTQEAINKAIIRYSTLFILLKAFFIIFMLQ